jgi:hypothetical protein
MNKVVLCIAIGCGLMIGTVGCSKGGKTPMSKEAAAAIEAAVTSSEIATTAKTPKGNALRAYEVKLANAPAATPGENNNATPVGDSCIVIVVGDPAVAVEFPNAKDVLVGGKKAQINMASNCPGVFLVPVTNPVTGFRQSELMMEDVRKMLKAGKFDVPLADQILTF